MVFGENAPGARFLDLKGKTVKNKKNEIESKVDGIKKQLEEWAVFYVAKCKKLRLMQYADPLKEILFYAHPKNRDEEFRSIAIRIDKKKRGLTLAKRLSTYQFFAGLERVRYMGIKKVSLIRIPICLEDFGTICRVFAHYPIKLFEFIDCCLTDRHLGLLAHLIPSLPDIQRIHLDHNTFTEKGIEAVSKALQINPVINRISLRYCEMNAECMKFLGEAIACSPIETAFLSGNSFGCRGLLNLMDSLVHFMALYQNGKYEEFLENRAKSDPTYNMQTKLEQLSQREDMKGLTTAMFRDKRPEKKAPKKKKKGKKGAEDDELFIPKPTPFLKRLFLADCMLNCRGTTTSLTAFDQLCAYITENTKMEELDLARNWLGYVPSVMLQRAVRRRSKLTQLPLKLYLLEGLAEETIVPIKEFTAKSKPFKDRLPSIYKI